MTLPQKLLKIPTQDLFTTVDDAEYLFHSVMEAGILEQFLNRFPNGNEVHKFIVQNVLNSEPLVLGWENDVLEEINSLIKIQEDPRLIPLTDYKYSDVFPRNSNEMGILIGSLSESFVKNRLEGLSKHEILFLEEFIYGIHNSFWTRFAVIIKYTNHNLPLENIVKVRRNRVRFTIEAQTLILENI